MPRFRDIEAIVTAQMTELPMQQLAIPGTADIGKRHAWKDGHVHPPMGERSLRILELASRIDGVTGAEANREIGGAKNSAGANCTWLADHGHLFRAKVPGEHLHFFSTQRAADRWMERNGGAQKPCGNVVPPLPRMRLAPVEDITEPGGPKHTRLLAPAVDERYQVDPNERPFGAGFGAAGIGRDITTGRAWGR